MIFLEMDAEWMAPLGSKDDPCMRNHCHMGLLTRYIISLQQRLSIESGHD